MHVLSDSFDSKNLLITSDFNIINHIAPMIKNNAAIFEIFFCKIKYTLSIKKKSNNRIRNGSAIR